jgi:hypothetical protein
MIDWSMNNDKNCFANFTLYRKFILKLCWRIPSATLFHRDKNDRHIMIDSNWEKVVRSNFTWLKVVCFMHWKLFATLVTWLKLTVLFLVDQSLLKLKWLFMSWPGRHFTILNFQSTEKNTFDLLIRSSKIRSLDSPRGGSRLSLL